jgi:hypothetical protein
MRPVRIILALLALAALALVGCTNRSSTHPAAAPAPPALAGTPTASTTRPVTAATPTTTPAPPQPSPRPPDPPAWSRSPRVTPQTDPAAQLTGIRTAQHANFDRVVFQFRGRVPGYDVRYVPAVTQDPSDQPIPLQGRAFIRVVLRHASTSPAPGGGPVPSFVGTITPGFQSLKQIKAAGDFEHYLTFGIGLDHRVGFRVFTLTDPSRVVIDVAHSPAPSPPFPGIWDIRTWQQARQLQDAVDNGHQPWRCGPDTLVTLYAQQVLHVAQPVVRRVDPVTFSVTSPGQGLIVTVTVTQPIRHGTCGIWVITKVIPSATATCAVSPTAGPAGSTTTLTCRAFAASEAVTITFGAETLAVARASASGGVAASFAVPDGFAGSHYPGRRDTFRAKGERSGKVASATFTVTG